MQTKSLCIRTLTATPRALLAIITENKATTNTKRRLAVWFALLAAISAGPASATTNTYDARAYSINLQAMLLGQQQLNVGPSPDTGYLPASGGYFDSTAASINAPPPPLFVQAYALHNTISGSSDTTMAKSTVLQLKLALYSGTTEELAVNADAISSTSTMQCSNGQRGIDQSQTGTSLAYLTVDVGGQNIVVPANPDANTTIPVGPAGDVISGSLILNEQFDKDGRHVVNGLHLMLQLAGGNSVDLIISHAEAGITCGTP